MKQGFKIMGIAVKTTNVNNQAANDLATLWGKFYSQNIMDKIPNKIDTDVLCIYTDYKSDYQDDYLAIIGVRVSQLDEVPEGLIGRAFAPETFKKFEARGKLPDAVVDCWLNIWNDDANLNRKYTYDYEVYGALSHNLEDSLVEIMIATK